MKKSLNTKQIHILRKKGTEPAFSGKLLHNKEDGLYFKEGDSEDMPLMGESLMLC